MCLSVAFADKADKEKEAKEKWKKKDIRDYSDADLERLFDQWEVCLCCQNFLWTFNLTCD